MRPARISPEPHGADAGLPSTFRRSSWPSSPTKAAARLPLSRNTRRFGGTATGFGGTARPRRPSGRPCPRISPTKGHPSTQTLTAEPRLSASENRPGNVGLESARRYPPATRTPLGRACPVRGLIARQGLEPRGPRVHRLTKGNSDRRSVTVAAEISRECFSRGTREETESPPDQRGLTAGAAPFPIFPFLPEPRSVAKALSAGGRARSSRLHRARRGGRP